MSNLYTELLEVLKIIDKTVDDIVWIGSKDGTLVIPKSELKDVFDVDYDDGFGVQKIASDLVVVGYDWWLERDEYDGSENWDYKSIPILQSEHAIAIRVLGTVGWRTMQDIINKE